MLFSALLLVPTVAHAATGTVSINGGTEVVTTGTATTVSVPIQISGSDPLNGFDVQVFADPTILQGASISLTGSIVTSPTIVVECINGILVAGSTCAPQDGSGVVHLSAVHIGALVSGSGLLFTINYNIVGQTAFTPLTFNTGCSGTSVASGDCVTISNGNPTAVSETDLNGSFANLNDFSMTPAFAKISTPSGVSISDAINYQALGAFSDLLTESVSVSPSGPTCATTNGFVDLTLPSGSDTLTCSSASNGDFTVTVTASGTSITHSVAIDLLVAPAGFSSSLNPTSLTIPRGFSDTTTVTLTGVSGFSGTVAITAAGPSGITGSASPAMVTLTHDASGYSTGTSTLTVSVAGTVATGVYSVAVTGGSVLSVTVPGSDFAISLSPDTLSVPRGSSIATQVNLQSLGAFAGTVTLTATVTPNGLDNDGVNNIVNNFLPATVTLTANGNGASAYFGSTVKIGTSPNPGNTATGNYIITITATSGSSSHSATLAFNLFDFSLGPSFCSGSTLVYTSTISDAFFDPVAVGESCNTFTATTQTAAQGGSQSTLWLQVNSLGGLQTHGAAGTGVIAAVNPTGPGRGSSVPELGMSVCFFQTFFANGTELSRSYIRANGPVVRAGPFSGCRFSFAYALPNDADAPICVPPDNPTLLDCVVPNNIDFYAVTADVLSHTLPGKYFVNVCGLVGTLLNCQMITLIVVQAPTVHQFVFKHSVSIAAGGLQTFKLGVSNIDANTIWAQVTVTATGSLGHTFTVSTAVVRINPNANANNLQLSIQLTSADKGETFTFSSSILVSAVDPGAVAVDPVNGTSSAGTSTAQSVIAIFTVTA